MRHVPRTRSSVAKRRMMGAGQPVMNMRMKRMEEKSEMEPTLLSYWSTGMRKRYQLICLFLPLRSEGSVSRLSTMKLRPTTKSSGRSDTWYW